MLWALNGWALAGLLTGEAPSTPPVVVTALIADMILVPVLIWAAYRTGQMVEEEIHRKAREDAAIAGQASRTHPISPASRGPAEPDTHA